MHQCIRPLIGAFAPGHHGYQRACGLINGQASTGHVGHQCSQAPGRPNLHLVSSSRRPRQVRGMLSWLRHRRLLIFRPPLPFVWDRIRRIGSRPDPSSVLRRPGHEPEHSRRFGRVCWRGRSPARCNGAASASIQGLSPWRSQTVGLISTTHAACTNRTRRRRLVR